MPNVKNGVPEPSCDEPAQEGSAESRRQRIERLYSDHNRTLVRFINARLHNEQEAREVAQEAYVRLLNLDEPDAVSYLRAFLFRIAANLASDRLKQKARRRDLRERLPFEQVDGRSPESGCLAREELDLIRLAAAELPPKCRMAFMLVKFGERSFDEVARHMGLSTRMVRIYVARALAHCQARLEAGNRP
jgi:RNA polymerase sigma-70 factor (ECF subfamily)